MPRTYSRPGRPLSPYGHLDRAAEQLVEARGRLVGALDGVALAVRALNVTDAQLRELRESLMTSYPAAA